MPPVELAGVMRYVLEYGRDDDDDIIQTFHAARPGVVDLQVLNNLAKELSDWLVSAAANWRAQLPTRVHLKRVITYDLQPGSNMAGEYSATAAGGGGSAVAPHQAAAVVTWLTEYRGTSFRGRTYWGPLPASWINQQGYIAAGNVDQLAGMAGVLLGQFAVLGTPLVVASFTHNHHHPIVGLQVDNSPDVQRRRALKPTQRVTAMLGD